MGFLEVADTHVRMKVETVWEVSKSAEPKAMYCPATVTLALALLAPHVP